MKEFKAPNKNDSNFFSIFLAGSIDMDKAEKWQDVVVKELKDYDVALLNPRRDDWDSSWKQRISDKQFLEQVDWEFNNLEAAKLIFLYFAPESQAPISLMELGLFADSKKLIVACPEKYWRRGNVEYICKKFNIPLLNSLDEGINAVKKKIFAYGK